MDPPGKTKTAEPMDASSADQKPRNGPKEKAKKKRSAPGDSGRPRICTQFSTMWLQLSAVSSQRIGTVVLPLVWWQRT